jgi:hypothetical protein
VKIPELHVSPAVWARIQTEPYFSFRKEHGTLTDRLTGAHIVEDPLVPETQVVDGVERKVLGWWVQTDKDFTIEPVFWDDAPEVKA